MAASKQVNANVLVFDPITGERHLIEAGEVPPADLRGELGDHLFVKADTDADTPRETPEDEAPPRSGRGSGRDEWAAYAAQHDVTVEDDMSRDDIVAALEAAGVVASE